MGIYHAHIFFIYGIYITSNLMYQTVIALALFCTLYLVQHPGCCARVSTLDVVLDAKFIEKFRKLCNERRHQYSILQNPSHFANIKQPKQSSNQTTLQFKLYACACTLCSPGVWKSLAGGKVTLSCFSSSGIILTLLKGGEKSTSNTFSVSPSTGW